MDLEFAAAERRLQKDRDSRRRAAASRQLREASVKERAAEAAERVRERAELRRRERIQALEEARRVEEVNQGVHYETHLRAVPRLKADTNRILLPKDALEALDSQRALDIFGSPLTFELMIRTASGERRQTHCGVEEFTAEQGTVGIPPAVALSLTREDGLDSLNGADVQVRLVKLPRYDKAFVAFQPRGQGFHINGEDVVNIDIKSVLLRTLRDTLTLSQGDWIPIRHDGQTFELVARQLQPEPALCVLNTDVEVELLPSEAVQAEERRVQAQKERMEARRMSIKQAAEAIPSEPGTGGVVLRVRLPDGRSPSRAFPKDCAFGAVLNWVRAELPEEVPEAVDLEGARGEFALVRAGLGHKSQTFDGHHREMTLEQLGLAAGRESLMASWRFLDSSAEPSRSLATPTSESNAGQESMRDAPGPAPFITEQHISSANAVANHKEASDFLSAKLAAEQELDRSLEEAAVLQAQADDTVAVPDDVPMNKVDVYHRLVADGVSPYLAADAAQKFSAQIEALEAMGFVSQWDRSLELLRKYNGRLERVVNILAGAD